MNDQHTFQYLKQFLTDERLGKIEHFAPESSDFVLPVMEDIFQFRNAAAIVRSVEACGFHKIVAMESENEFNPNLHNAIKQTEDENFGDNIVCEVFQKGYMLNDKVIRHAVVAVAN